MRELGPLRAARSRAVRVHGLATRPPADELSRWPGDRMPSGHRGCAAAGAQTARSVGIHAQCLTAEPLSPAGRLCAVTGLSPRKDDACRDQARLYPMWAAQLTARCHA